MRTLATLLCVLLIQPLFAFQHFVARDGDRLLDGAGELRFVSCNIPTLHYNKDCMAFARTNPWRLPDEFEIRDALRSIRQIGGRVARTYVLSVRRPEDDPTVPRHVEAPGRFNETAFRALDLVMKVANEEGVRIIVPLVDNWTWWGGVQEYAGFRGKRREAFWTDPQVKADFKQTIDFIVNRTNTYTGTSYKDDKALLGWELGNELDGPPEWSAEMASYIKRLDQNHLVIEGYAGDTLREASLVDPNIDIVTSHHYEKTANAMIAHIVANAKMVKGRKVYYVGEFGFIPTEGVKRLLDTVIEKHLSGAMIWSLRFHRREGGFYWHSEPAGGNRYKAYHWPGFPSGAGYDETALLALLRREAYAIRGVSPPPRAVPEPPVLRRIRRVWAIAWQGSAGADGYRVERAAAAEGPWMSVAEDVSDAAVAYRPLWNDDTIRTPGRYYYRVRARNSAGTSEPSGVVGPVRVRAVSLVDEMRDDSQLFHTSGPVSFVTDETRKAKEDMHRLAGEAGATLTYHINAPMRSARIDVFFPGDVVDLRISTSKNNENYEPLRMRRRDFFSGTGDYDYWKPVRYDVRNLPPEARYLRIECETAMQIGRIEIVHALAAPEGSGD